MELYHIGYIGGESMISVIVAAYNVEAYIKKCILSILNQTFKNLEVIVVNDGSTDATLEIVEALVQKDNRIKLINKVNGGLSSARNTGLEVATGDYVGFIDGDDYISENMYKILMQLMIDYEADLSVCGVVYEYENRSVFTNSNTVKVYDSLQALALLIESREFEDIAVNKLYKRSLFEGICYPVGKIYEDVFTTYRLFDKCHKIVMIDSPEYFYVQRNGSILRSGFSDKQFHHLEAINEIKEFAYTKDYQQLLPYIENRETTVKTRMIYDMLKQELFLDDPAYRLDCISLMKQVRKESIRYFLNQKSNWINKAVLILSFSGYSVSLSILKCPLIKKLLIKKAQLL